MSGDLKEQLEIQLEQPAVVQTQVEVLPKVTPIFDIKAHDQKVQSINDKMAEATAQMNKALAELANSKPKAPTIVGEAKGLTPVALKFETTATTGTVYSIYLFVGQKIVYTFSAYAAQGQLQTLAACIIKAFGEVPKEIMDSIEVHYD